jgi:hypothetical protein
VRAPAAVVLGLPFDATTLPPSPNRAAPVRREEEGNNSDMSPRLPGPRSGGGDGGGGAPVFRRPEPLVSNFVARTIGSESVQRADQILAARESDWNRVADNLERDRAALTAKLQVYEASFLKMLEFPPIQAVCDMFAAIHASAALAQSDGRGANPNNRAIATSTFNAVVDELTRLESQLANKLSPGPHNPHNPHNPHKSSAAAQQDEGERAAH